MAIKVRMRKVADLPVPGLPVTRAKPPSTGPGLKPSERERPPPPAFHRPIDQRWRSPITPSLPFCAQSLRRSLILFAVLMPVWLVESRAAEIDGVQLPTTLQMDGKTLQLNGYGVRTYSVLGIHIYVAGLYLEHLSTRPDEILRSSETKLLTVRFRRDVSAEKSRNAWREGLLNNCVSPCRLDPKDVEAFLSQITDMNAGDSYDLLFTQRGATVTVGGHTVGTVSKPQFAQAMLATFLGPKPGSPSLKHDLLRGHS
jgi:Chalcone isomerase-like